MISPGEPWVEPYESKRLCPSCAEPLVCVGYEDAVPGFRTYHYSVPCGCYRGFASNDLLPAVTKLRKVSTKRIVALHKEGPAFAAPLLLPAECATTLDARRREKVAYFRESARRSEREERLEVWWAAGGAGRVIKSTKAIVLAAPKIAEAYTVGSLFSGIGGIDLAFQWAGFEISFQVEIDDYCNRVLAKHWPDVTRHRDVKAVGASCLPVVDVLIGGFPCQDISSAGRGAGIKEGTRSGLWLEFARIIGEIRPRYVLLENVAAITSRDGTRVIADLTALGYDAEWGIIPASAVGAPHRRERWWCVAYRNNSQPARANDEICAGRDAVDACRTASVVHAQGPERQSTGTARRRRAGFANTGGVGQADAKESRLESVINKPSFGGSASADNKATRSRVSDPQQLAKSERRRLEITGQATSQPFNSAARADGQTDRTQYAGEWQTQPVLGRAVNGLSRQLDGARWPARPDEAQYRWEAPRTKIGVPQRTARLKALGNAVVPQVVQPIAEAIREALAREDATLA